MTQSEQLLKELVEALENTYWSSWQSTYQFDEQYRAAVDYLREREENEFIRNY